MEGIAPTLKCLIEIQFSIQNGESIRSSVSKFLRARPASDDCARDLRAFMFSWDQGGDYRRLIGAVQSPHRRALLALIASGLAVQTILGQLEELKKDVMDSCDGEIRYHLEILPVKMLAPLLFLQFPAFLLLLFGPLLAQLIEELNR